MFGLMALFGTSLLTAEPENSPQMQFESDRKNMWATTFVLADDNVSQYHYIIYKDKFEKRKIRYGWNGGCCSEPVIQESFFMNKKLVLFREMSVAKDIFEEIAYDDTVEVFPIDEYYFYNSNLTRWTKNKEEQDGKGSIAWVKKQNRILQDVRNALQTYSEYKSFEEPLNPMQTASSLRN